MKKLILSYFLLVSLISCKNETQNTTVINTTSQEFTELLNSFNTEGYELDPIKATMAGIEGYNDKYPDFLSEDYKAKKKAYYTKYKTALLEIDESNLTDTEKMSKAVLLWDCDINLEEMTFQKDLMPIDQMWSKNLSFNQLASGSTSQP